MKRRDKATTNRAGALQVEVTLELPRGRRGPPTDLGRGKKPTHAAGQIPRITRLMALAIKFQEMVDRGEVRDYADIARLGYITRARLTQIMSLLLLAPDLQETVLFELGNGECHTSEKDLRRVVKLVLWDLQRDAWHRRSSEDRPLGNGPPGRRSAVGNRSLTDQMQSEVIDHIEV
jgi:hypothetical protein